MMMPVEPAPMVDMAVLSHVGDADAVAAGAPEHRREKADGVRPLGGESHVVHVERRHAVVVFHAHDGERVGIVALGLSIVRWLSKEVVIGRTGPNAADEQAGRIGAGRVDRRRLLTRHIQRRAVAQPADEEAGAVGALAW